MLNAFLDSARRGRRFEYRSAAPASIKDTIEALGVPHPAVDLIRVNGQPVDFTYRTGDDDAVSVYPRFRRLDVARVRPRVGVEWPTPIRFVNDMHLGRLAALLRRSGFDMLLREGDAAIADRAARDE